MEDARSDSHVRLFLANNIPDRVVETHMVCRRTELPIKEVAALCDAAPNLCRRLPHNLGEMVERRIKRVVCLDRELLHRIHRCEETRTSDQVLSEGPKLSSSVRELAFLRPCVCFGGQVVGPGERCRAMCDARRVVAVEVLRDLGGAGGR